MKEIYETKISTGRWIAYDLPGNAGWILYFICCYQLIKQNVDLFVVVALVPALLMLVGIVELISERIARLDRVLPRIRLWRGFGALTLGGALGMAAAVGGILLQKGGIAWQMLAGGVLCALFAGLLLCSYHKSKL
ncbi:MAG: hypothetical protein IJ240_01860 [Clostridia bacterium]|nr:hypothetical protein [Clostridia bacterium]